MPGQDISLHWAELVRDAVDDEGLHTAQHDSELLVGVLVGRDGCPGIELDQVHHRAFTEERAAFYARDETERRDIGEPDELCPHAGIIPSRTLRG